MENGQLEYLKTKVQESLSEDEYVFEDVRHMMEAEYGPMETTLYWNGDYDAVEHRDKNDAMTDFYQSVENEVISKVLRHVLSEMVPNEAIKKAADAVVEAVYDTASEVDEVEDILFERLEKHYGKPHMEKYWNGELAQKQQDDLCARWNQIHEDLMSEVFTCIGEQS